MFYVIMVYQGDKTKGIVAVEAKTTLEAHQKGAKRWRDSEGLPSSVHASTKTLYSSESREEVEMFYEALVLETRKANNA